MLYILYSSLRGLPGGSVVKRIHLPIQELQEKWVQSLGWEDPLEESMATHSNILPWEISRTEYPRMQCMGYRVAKSQTRLSDFTFALCTVRVHPPCLYLSLIY